MTECFDCECLLQLIRSNRTMDREKLRYLINYYNYKCSLKNNCDNNHDFDDKCYDHHDNDHHDNDKHCHDDTYINHIPCVPSQYFKNDCHHQNIREKKHCRPCNNYDCNCLIDCRRPEALIGLLLSEAECDCCQCCYANPYEENFIDYRFKKRNIDQVINDVQN